MRNIKKRALAWLLAVLMLVGNVQPLYAAEIVEVDEIADTTVDYDDEQLQETADVTVPVETEEVTQSEEATEVVADTVAEEDTVEPQAVLPRSLDVAVGENEELIYFADCGADVFPEDVQALMSRYADTVKNAGVTDKQYDGTWGYTNVDETEVNNYNEVANPDAYDTIRNFYGSVNGKTLQYKFAVDAGKYRVVVGMHNPWSDRNARISVGVDGAQTGSAQELACNMNTKKQASFTDVVLDNAGALEVNIAPTQEGRSYDVMVGYIAVVREKTVEEISGTCGESLNWVLGVDDVLTISGTGAMYNYTYTTHAPWFEHKDRIQSVVMEDGATTIGEYAFSSCDKMTNIAIPNTVTSIKMNSFSGCNTLKNVTIPASVADIHFNAFQTCEKLTKITVAEDNQNYQSIQGALYNKPVTKLICCPDGFKGTLNIPEGVTRIEQAAAEGCTGLTDVTIPNTLTFLGTYAFRSCSGLKEVTFPDSYQKSISKGAFQDCIALKTVKTGNGVTEVGENAFKGCTGLKNVTIGTNVNKVNLSAFSGCTNLLNVVFEGNAPSISTNAFYNVTANAYYPAEDTTWTETKRQNYGGTLTWLTGEPEATATVTFKASAYGSLVDEDGNLHGTYQPIEYKDVKVGTAVKVPGTKGNKGYALNYWKNSAGEVVELGDTLEVAADETYTAYFTEKDITITFKVKDNTGATIKKNDRYSVNLDDYTVQAKFKYNNTSLRIDFPTLTAWPGYEYKTYGSLSNTYWVDDSTGEKVFYGSLDRPTADASFTLVVGPLSNREVYADAVDKDGNLIEKYYIGKVLLNKPSVGDLSSLTAKLEAKGYTYCKGESEDYEILYDAANHAVVNGTKEAVSDGKYLRFNVVVTKVHTVTVDVDGEQSTIKVTDEEGKLGDEMPADPVKKGYDFKGWNTAADGTGETVTAETPITADTTIYAIFEKAWPFVDVHEDDWFYSSVKYVYENGLLTGTSETTFSPKDPMTRGMLVSVLYRLEGRPEVEGENKFPDVNPDKYYAKAIQWAADNKIVSGYTDGTFGPEDSITREQMAKIIYRYVEFRGGDVSNTIELDAYRDANQISTYAVRYVKWAVAEGILKGSNGKLNPKGNATRAEISAVMRRVCQTYGLIK